MNRIKIIAGATALAIVSAAAVAVSQTAENSTRRWHHGDFEHRILGFMTHHLDLTDAQQAQVKQIIATEKSNVLPLVQQLAQTRQQLQQLEASGTFEENKVRVLASAQSQTMTELIVEKAKITSEVFNILTPEQKTKAIQFLNRREGEFHKHLQQEREEPAQQQ